jgi:Tol biopolymer transport system component
MNKHKILLGIVLLSPLMAVCQPAYFSLCWAPDNKTIMFSTEEEKSDGKLTYAIFTIEANGKNRKQIIDGALAPDWSNKNSRIVWTKPSHKGSNIFTSDPDGTNTKQITFNEFNNYEPSFSPDGKSICFESDETGIFQLYMILADGSNKQMLTTGTFNCFTPRWSSDGRQILFYKDVGKRQDVIHILRLNDKVESIVLKDSLSDFYSSWSPEGRILFTRALDKVFSPKRTGIFTVMPDGSQLTRIGNLNGWLARYSPDGKRIAFIQKTSDGSSRLMSCNSDGTHLELITN